MKEAVAFRHEFYKEAQESQIRDDIISYLAEYRFEVAEFNYTLGIKDGRLTDPRTGESMLHKAKKAIETKLSDGLGSSREQADFEGIVNLENQLKENPLGTIAWFSPPGPSDYGFAYIGKRAFGHKVEMTAIRLEKPNLKDFNRASAALWGKGDYVTPEDFIRSPKVLNVGLGDVKEFIHGNFEIKDEKERNIFQEAVKKMDAVINECIRKIKNGTRDEKGKVFNVLENLAIELRGRLENRENYLESTELNLASLLSLERYLVAAPAVNGSCGISSSESSNLISFRTGLISKVFGESEKKDWDFDQPGPCRLCGEDVPCGPCKICESCNDKIDTEEMAA